MGLSPTLESCSPTLNFAIPQNIFYYMFQLMLLQGQQTFHVICLSIQIIYPFLPSIHCSSHSWTESFTTNNEKKCKKKRIINVLALLDQLCCYSVLLCRYPVFFFFSLFFSSSSSSSTFYTRQTVEAIRGGTFTLHIEWNHYSTNIFLTETSSL